MNRDNVVQAIKDGKTYLGMELGSTRIKAMLIGEDHLPIASGSHLWENRFEQNMWTYQLEDAWMGLQKSYGELAKQVQEEYGVTITSVGGIGFSGMMHGYLVFDKEEKQLVPFRTWRNTMTEQAADFLTQQFEFNVPQRWGIAHLYQAILNEEEHVGQIASLTTLSGYIHWKLTGEKVLGIGDASGLFPIDSVTNDYNAGMIHQFDTLVTDKKYPWTLKDILPKVLAAGDRAGTLTKEGAKLLDSSGQLQSGIPVCPPEGDAGTGMVATNSVAERTGNISAGTSIFTMIVLEKELSKVYQEIDMVTTPSGKPVAMVHCNNCTSELDAWIKLFREVNAAAGAELTISEIYETLYNKALEGEPDCGGIIPYNYISGEQITKLEAGRPLLVRMPDSRFSLANFMRAQLYSAMATLKLGMDILFDHEQVRLDKLLGHGGLFKTRTVGQRLMAAAMNTPVAVMETAGEGGSWGIAILAAFMVNRDKDNTLEAYLDENVFLHDAGTCIHPEKEDVQGFLTFMEAYTKGLAVERAAVEAL